MANVSDWKGFEKMVAEALGGKRRHRTMGSFATEADDIRFDKKFRKKFPKVRGVSVECKKRKSLNLHSLYAEATQKYGLQGKKHIVLASKVTHKRNLKKRLDEMKERHQKNYEKKLINLIRKKKLKGKRLRSITKRFQRELAYKIKLKEIQIRLRHDITALVTVELSFFRELWEAWIHDNDNG